MTHLMIPCLFFEKNLSKLVLQIIQEKNIQLTNPSIAHVIPWTQEFKTWGIHHYMQ